jgi:hypothetical protein
MIGLPPPQYSSDTDGKLRLMSFGGGGGGGGGGVACSPAHGKELERF